MRAIGPATNICHQNAAQKFTGHAEAKHSGSSASVVLANTNPIKLIASDIPVTIHTVHASACACALSFARTNRLMAFCARFDTTKPSTIMTIAKITGCSSSAFFSDSIDTPACKNVLNKFMKSDIVNAITAP